MEKIDHIIFGGDYNPDQWDDSVIHKDMELFRKAGINTVALPVFAWAKLEPEEGKYDFEWLDRILDLLEENGISYFLATPTSAEPAWMSRKYPDILPVDIAGRKRTYGMRVNYCVNSPSYRSESGSMAEAMALRYGKRRGLIGWHISNEYGTYCYCENCRKKFISWTKDRYHDLDGLNSAWNTSFWGRILYDFGEIELPTELNDDYQFNPALQLDYMRFMTDSTIACFDNEADVIRKITPDIPVFTNISGFIKKLDQFRMVQHMDFAGWDNYPAPHDDPSLTAMKHDIMRAAGDGSSYLVTEQSPDQQNWQPYNKLKRPGEVRRLAYQGLAHGSDSCMYFQMRQSAAGQEKFHGALISHNGRDDTRIFREVSALGEEFAKLGGRFVGGRSRAQVGFIFDWDNWWALELASGPSKDMDYLSQVNTYYRQFYDMDIPVDFLKTDSELDGYRIIAAPLLYMLKKGVAERLERFVADGGILIATYMTGYADENDRCIFGAYPGKLRDALGMWVEETDALYPEESNSIIDLSDNKKYSCHFLCDLIHLETAKPLAEYASDFYSGLPAVTENDFGKGKAYYIATQTDAGYLQKLFKSIAAKAEVRPIFESSCRMEITARDNEKGRTFFIINQDSCGGTVNLGNDIYMGLTDGKEYTGTVNVSSGDVMILKKK